MFLLVGMMSGLVDEAVKLYKAEEVRLNQTIQQYKELIRSMFVFLYL